MNAYKSYDQLSDDERADLSQCGAVGFTFEEVSLLFNLDPSEVRRQFSSKSGDIYMAYIRGRLQAELLLRQKLFSSACNGSNPAQSQMLQLYQQADNAHRDLEF